MAGENGKSALQYLLEEVDGTVTSMEGQRPNFQECPVGKDFAEQQFRGTLLMLKMQRIYVRDSLAKAESESQPRSNGGSGSDGGRGKGRGSREGKESKESKESLWGFIKIGSDKNYVQASGVVALALVLVYLVLKVHGVPAIP